MKYSVIAASSALLLASTSAISLGPRRTPAPRTVGIDLERNNGALSNALSHDRARLRRRIQRRAGVVSETLNNEETLYFANLTLGTPAQSLRMHIDTGSSDLWVNTANSTICEDTQNGGCSGGTYDSSSSSTYAFVNGDFNISYIDGSGASGDYVKDTLAIGGETLTDFQFGLGFVSSSSEGVLGVGYAENEVQVNRAGLGTYPNLPQAMVNAGLINSNAYSLWLNDLDASTGMILFGGVNTAKYSGDLATIPILKEFGFFLEFLVALTGLSVAGTSESSSPSLPASVLLDSGTTLTYLPNDLTTAIYDKVSAVYDGSYAYVACSVKDTSSTIDFDFSGQIISVPFNELVLDPAYTSGGIPLTMSDGEAACTFGIAPALSSQAVLGDTFLRSAYVVYDLANNQISIAQTVFNSSSDDVREITTGGVPGAVAVASAVSTAVGSSSTGTTLDSGALSGAGAVTHIQVTGAILAAVAVVFMSL